MNWLTDCRRSGARDRPQPTADAEAVEDCLGAVRRDRDRTSNDIWFWPGTRRISTRHPPGTSSPNRKLTSSCCGELTEARAIRDDPCRRIEALLAKPDAGLRPPRDCARRVETVDRTLAARCEIDDARSARHEAVADDERALVAAHRDRRRWLNRGGEDDAIRSCGRGTRCGDRDRLARPVGCETDRGKATLAEEEVVHVTAVGCQGRIRYLAADDRQQRIGSAARIDSFEGNRFADRGRDEHNAAGRSPDQRRSIASLNLPRWREHERGRERPIEPPDAHLVRVRDVGRISPVDPPPGPIGEPGGACWRRRSGGSL